jgi:hypothetical protein
MRQDISEADEAIGDALGIGRPAAQALASPAPPRSSMATTLVVSDDVQGVRIRRLRSRRVRFERNPHHPEGPGLLDPALPRTVRDLHATRRVLEVRRSGAPSSWTAFFQQLRLELERLRVTEGAGLRILTRTAGSPSEERLLREIQKRYPLSRRHDFGPVGRSRQRAGAFHAFGQDVDPVYRLKAADVIVAFDSDFLGSGPGHLRYAEDFRRVRREGALLYVVEPGVTDTGRMAWVRQRVAEHDIPGCARELAAYAGVGARPDGRSAASAAMAAAAARLRLSRGRGLVLAGAGLPPEVHSLLHAVNYALGNVGSTIDYIEPAVADLDEGPAALLDLARDMESGRVDLLLILGGDPVGLAPANLDLARAMSRVALCAHLSAFRNRTTDACEWHLPEAHALEAWGDARAYDGSASIIQPVVEPSGDVRTSLELLSAVAYGAPRPALDLVRETWSGAMGRDGFEVFWRSVLRRGVVPGTARRPVDVALRVDWSPPRIDLQPAASA